MRSSGTPEAPNGAESDRLWKELILVFAAFFLPGFALQGRTGSGQSFDDPVYLVSIILQAVPQTLLLIYIVYIGEKGKLENFGILSPRWSDVPRGVGVGVLTFAVVIPLQLLLSGTGSGGFTWQFTNPALIPLVVVATLAAAYREEVFFRAYALTRLETLGVKPIPAAAVASVAFGLGHVYQGVAGFVVAFAIGLVMSGIFLRTRSLHAIGIGHGLYNFVVLVLPNIYEYLTIL